MALDEIVGDGVDVVFGTVCVVDSIVEFNFDVALFFLVAVEGNVDIVVFDCVLAVVFVAFIDVVVIVEFVIFVVEVDGDTVIIVDFLVDGVDDAEISVDGVVVGGDLDTVELVVFGDFVFVIVVSCVVLFEPDPIVDITNAGL